MTTVEMGYTADQMERSRILLDRDRLSKRDEFKKLESLLRNKGREESVHEGYKIVSLVSEDFNDIDEKIGLAMFFGFCFEKPMSLNGVSLINCENAKISFIISREEMLGFWGEKITSDFENRTVYYVDIVGVDRVVRSSGIGKILGKTCLDHRLRTTDRDMIVLTRTQNPMMVAALKGCLPERALLYPFDMKPDEIWVKSVNWLVSSGFISRNARLDSIFDANKNLIHWGAYGVYGDGSTWENMIDGYDVDWTKSTASRMSGYLLENGTNLEEALKKGHAFIVGTHIRR